MKKMKKVSKLTTLALFVSLAMILSFIEHQIPPLVAIPGIKLGLPNVAIVFVLYGIGEKEAVAVSLVRIFLVSVLFGSVMSLMYSVAGAVLSLTVMILLKKSRRFSCVTVSVTGGVCHNIGQIIVACFVTKTAELVYYLPVLLISGVVAGVLIGLISGIVLKRMEKL